MDKALILANPPLIRYALKGLKSCWMPEKQMFSHAFVPERRPDSNVSIPNSDVYYTLNVLLGLSRVSDLQDTSWDIPQIFENACSQLPQFSVPIYAYGMAMWVSKELDLELPDPTHRKIQILLSDTSSWMRWRAQDLGSMLSGVVAQASGDRKRWEHHSHALMEHISHYHGGSDSGLFFDSTRKMRRHFATYATGVYLILAHFHYGEFFNDQNTIDRALRCVRALGEQQGPHGEWPWYFEVNSGRVLDPYQVYSVHQDGMAPAYLHLAEKHGDLSARDSIIRGFQWILGDNELHRDMLVPEYGIVLRSHMRAESLERYRRAGRAIINRVTRQSSRFVGPSGLVVNRECRSYHLGWILWSFCNRPDYTDLTDHSAFERALAL